MFSLDSITAGEQQKRPNWRNQWLAMAQSLWLALTILTLALFFIGVPGRFEQLTSTVDQRSLEELNISAAAFATYVVGLNVVIVLAHTVTAAVIFWRRPDEWMALLVAYVLVANGAILPLSLMARAQPVSPLWRSLVDVVTAFGLVSSVILLYLFPDGRFVPPWTRLLAAGWAILTFLAIFLPNSPLSLPAWPILLQLLVLLAWSGSGVVVQIYRYENVSSLLQRQQTKWALLGLTAAALAPFAYYLPFVIFPSISGPAVPNILYQRMGASYFTFSLLLRLGSMTVFVFILLLFPLSFAVAILRYRLWDIDVFIRRTLIYSMLTAVLALVYFGSVVLLEQFLHIFAGRAQSEIVTIVSTLVIATLFTPLRQRVQGFIDSRFYRRKYDAQKTLAAFSATLRDEVDLDALAAELLQVVEETMQPAHTSLWLKPAGDRRNTVMEA
ncbi:MAG TPA: hypothetical protein VF177_22620, partial [Anaerolineae bacterium]